MPASTTLSWHEGGVPAGRAVVLLHGWASDARADFHDSGLVAALGRDGYRVLAVDLPGHGGSADVAVPQEANPGDWAARAILADLDRLGCADAAVLGAGAGGQIAAHVAVRGGDRVRALAVVGCDDRSGIPHGRQVAAGLLDPSARVWSPETADLVVAGRSCGGDPRTLARFAEAVGWPAAPRLGALRTPALVAVAGDDAEARRRVPRLAGLLHDAHLLVVPGPTRALLRAPRLAEAVSAFLAASDGAVASAAGG